MDAHVRQPRDLFTLDVLSRHLGGYQVPAGVFDPSGPWTQTYGIYTLARQGGRLGHVRLTREPTPPAAFTLGLEYEKRKSLRYVQRISAQMQCRADALSTPTAWRFTAVSLDPQGKPTPNTRIEKSAEAEAGEVVFTCHGRATRVPLPGPHTLRWALLDAVQRLPRDPSLARRLTLIDHFDQVKPDQELHYRGTERVHLGAQQVRREQVVQLDKGRVYRPTLAEEGGQAVQLHRFTHVGRGVVPWVYWVTDAGRVLFAVSGLEGYVLEPPSKAKEQ